MVALAVDRQEVNQAD